MPVDSVHRKGSAQVRITFNPTTSPDALMPVAVLTVPPSVPRSRGTPFVHSTAELDVWLSDPPTTRPRLFILKAIAVLSPASGGRARRLPPGAQTNEFKLGSCTRTSPRLLIAFAPPGPRSVTV